AWKARVLPLHHVRAVKLVPSRGLEPLPNGLKSAALPLELRRQTEAPPVHFSSCIFFLLSARRGDRTHLKRIKNPLPHQSAWRAWSPRRTRARLIMSTIRFSKTPSSVDAAAIVGRPGIEPGWLKRAPDLQSGPHP